MIAVSTSIFEKHCKLTERVPWIMLTIFFQRKMLNGSGRRLRWGRRKSAGLGWPVRTVMGMVASIYAGRNGEHTASLYSSMVVIQRETS